MIKTDKEVWEVIDASRGIIALGFFIVGRPLQVWDDAVALMKQSGEIDKDVVGLIAMGLITTGKEVGQWAAARGWRPAKPQIWSEFGPYGN